MFRIVNIKNMDPPMTTCANRILSQVSNTLINLGCNPDPQSFISNRSLSTRSDAPAISEQYKGIFRKCESNQPRRY